MTDESASDKRDKLLTVLVKVYGFSVEVPLRGVSGRRSFRFDAARPDLKLGLDYHGWGSGVAHRSRKAVAGDHEKVCEAALSGWRYLICDALSVDNGKCLAYVRHALGVERVPGKEVKRVKGRRGATAGGRRAGNQPLGPKARA